MKRNSETEMIELDYVVAVTFDAAAEKVAAWKGGISELLCHIPRYWTVTQGMKETLQMLFTSPNVNGTSMLFELPLGMESEAGMQELLVELNELVEAKLSPGIKLLVQGENGSDLLIVQHLFYGDRMQVLASIRNSGTPEIPVIA